MYISKSLVFYDIDFVCRFLTWNVKCITEVLSVSVFYSILINMIKLKTIFLFLKISAYKSFPVTGKY